MRGVRRFLAAVLGGVLLVVAPAVAPLPASAAGSVTLSTNPVPVALGSFEPVTVRWTGQVPNTLVFLIVCRRPSTAPGFEVGSDCAPLTQVTPNGTRDGAGTAEVPVFRGPDPSGDLNWGCFAPEDTPPPGIEKVTECFVRLTTDVVLNNDAAVDVPVRVTGRGAPPSRGALGAPTGAPPATVEGVTGPPAPAAPTRPAPMTFVG